MTTQMKAADQHFHVILHAPSGLTFLTEMFTNTSVILLQIVMVSATPEPSSPGSKTIIPELKMFGPLCDQTVKDILSKAQQRLNEICVVKQPQKSHEQDILQKHLQTDR